MFYDMVALTAATLVTSAALIAAVAVAPAAAQQLLRALPEAWKLH